jgi:sulfate adenylyltransferase subunit 2
MTPADPAALDTSVTASPMPPHDHLAMLESESIHIMREVVAEFERPVLLFSGGKDSIVMLRVAEKAFYPGPLPFPLLHVDTGHNFPEVLAYRDRRAAELGARLMVASVEEAIAQGLVLDQTGPRASRNSLQTVPLLKAIQAHRFDAVFGGARRDEEKSRAKERVFSIRSQHGQWDPKNQRPELWSLYNGRCRPGEHIRIFPLSNWTELDIWQYVGRERLELPSIYFAHEREVFRRDGLLMAVTPVTPPLPGEESFRALVRYRTVGDMTCTAAVASDATTVAQIIDDIATSRITERGASRADDRSSEAAMEERKREGYF